MTQDSLDGQLDVSIESFAVIPAMTPELAESLVSQGFFTFDDLSVIEPDQLCEISGLSPEDCDSIIEFADAESLKAEERDKLAAEQKRSPVARDHEGANGVRHTPVDPDLSGPATGSEPEPADIVSNEAVAELKSADENAGEQQ